VDCKLKLFLIKLLDQFCRSDVVQRDYASSNKDNYWLGEKQVFDLLKGFVLILLCFQSLVLFIRANHFGDCVNFWVFKCFNFVFVWVNNEDSWNFLYLEKENDVFVDANIAPGDNHVHHIRLDFFHFLFEQLAVRKPLRPEKQQHNLVGMLFKKLFKRHH
jgi:hypothetical protein